MIDVGSQNATTFQPYRAWRWFAAEDTNEVTAEYTRIFDGWEMYGDYQQPDMANEVMVVGAGFKDGRVIVWYIEDGKLDYRDSWELRRIPWIVP